MKNPLELMEWMCFLGKHKVKGGARYADKDGHYNCEYHTPYLK